MPLTITPVSPEQMPASKKPSAHATEMQKIVHDFVVANPKVGAGLKIEPNGDGPSARAIVMGLGKAIKAGVGGEIALEAVNIDGTVYLRRK